MRTRQQGANSVRLWERGVIATDCGDGAQDDIGYFSQYKPDIEGSSDATCDIVFNRTVLAYSHENIKHLGHTMNDLLNIWSMLWVSNNLYKSSDIVFLNIDGFRKNKIYEDQLFQFER